MSTIHTIPMCLLGYSMFSLFLSSRYLHKFREKIKKVGHSISEKGRVILLCVFVVLLNWHYKFCSLLSVMSLIKSSGVSAGMEDDEKS